MAAITAAEITYSTVDRINTMPGRVRRNIVVSFPTGPNAGTNNTYATGGVALDRMQLGCPRRLQRLAIIGVTPVAGASNPAWVWNGDGASPKLVAMANAALGGGDAELANATAIPATQQLLCEVEGY
jgi:hypothetical protein